VENNRAVGVELEKGQVIKAKYVVSDAGARNTYTRLLTEAEAKYATTPEFVDALIDGGKDAKSPGGTIPGAMAPSCTLLNLFVGFDKNCEDLGIPATNAWVSPSWDHDKNAADFLKGNGEGEFPVVFIGSNSAKDESYKKRYGRAGERSGRSWAGQRANKLSAKVVHGLASARTKRSFLAGQRANKLSTKDFPGQAGTRTKRSFLGSLVREQTGRSWAC
jgi:hypothetical protein